MATRTKTNLELLCDENGGGLPIPHFMGRGPAGRSEECDRPGARNYYSVGIIDNQPVGFVACDNVCAAFYLQHILEVVSTMDLDDPSSSPTQPAHTAESDG